MPLNVRCCDKIVTGHFTVMSTIEVLFIEIQNQYIFLRRFTSMGMCI